MKKNWQLFLALCLVLSMVLSGCSQTANPAPDSQTQSSDQTDPTPSTPSDEVRTRPAHRPTRLRCPVLLDPHYLSLIVEQTISAQIYETLIFIEDDGTERPVLAADYTVSEDGLTYAFNLRQARPVPQW